MTFSSLTIILLRLFNDPTISDIKLKHTHNGRTREYYAHKAILYFQSTYFLDVFTNTANAHVELGGDDPAHFEFAIKFMYTLDYHTAGAEAEAEAAPDAQLTRLQFIIGVGKVAQKYKIPTLLKHAIDDLVTRVNNIKDIALLEPILTVYYSKDVSPGTQIGEILTNASVLTHRGFSRTPRFSALLRELPGYGSDVAIAMHAWGMFKVRRSECGGCGRWNHVDDSGIALNIPIRVVCWHCGKDGDILSSG
jgi:hypothetical protein